MLTVFSAPDYGARWRNDAHGMLPRDETELRRIYTGTSSEALYHDARVRVIIGSVQAADERSVRLRFSARGEEVREEVVWPDAVVTATGSEVSPLPDLPRGATFAGDLVNGLGVWAHALGVGVHGAGADLRIERWPRSFDEMWRRARTSARAASAADMTRFVTCMSVQLCRFVREAARECAFCWRS